LLHVLRAVVISFVGQYKFSIPVDWVDQTVDHAVVGRCAKSEEDHSSVWVGRCILFGNLLFASFY
jgi:hypothetical protein